MRTARASPPGRWARWSVPGRGCSRRRRPHHERRGSRRPWRVVPEESDRADEPALLRPAGRGRSPRPAAPSAVPGVAPLLRAALGTGPARIVFEDLHWADSGTLDFIDHMPAGARRPHPRRHPRPPRAARTAPRLGRQGRNFTSPFLEPLSEQAMRQLLAGLVPGPSRGCRLRHRRARRRDPAVRRRDGPNAGRRWPPRREGRRVLAHRRPATSPCPPPSAR